MRRPALLLLASCLPAAAAAPGEQPFPAPDRSRILREEKTTYLVDGSVTIPRGVEISIQKDVYIKAKGGGAARIVVEGNLEVHGVSAREVIFEGVTVVPAASFQKIQLDTCIFRGGGLATAEGSAAEGNLQVQGCRFESGARIQLAVVAGSLELLDGSAGGTVRLLGVVPEGKTNRVKAVLRGFHPGGLHAEGLADLTVRLCAFGEGPVTLKDVGDLTFDGCKVEAKEISFLQSKAGGFARTKVMKCDLYSKRIVFRSPADPKVSDTVVLDKCWFEGERDLEALAKRIVDVADDKANNVTVKVLNPMERPHEMAGKLNR
ncbi:MAG: hypothetical protein HUU06_07070 [Planctomycetaceae bacterium]|nr:hypothetical protein [Planctomycetota bacterium]NUN52530.1 hypothetical protein [Planctomycetaceae bacterium]